MRVRRVTPSWLARLVRDWELRIQLIKSWNRWAWWSLGRVLVVVALQVVQRHRVVPFVVVAVFSHGAGAYRVVGSCSFHLVWCSPRVYHRLVLGWGCCLVLMGLWLAEHIFVGLVLVGLCFWAAKSTHFSLNPLF